VHFKQFSAPDLVGKINSWVKELKTGNHFPKLVHEMEQEAKDKKEHHLENMIETIGYFFVPLFFVYTGLQVDIRVFFDLQTVFLALIITAIAFLGKLACGYVSGKNIDHKLVGVGMAPRGEVGLIFLNVGKKLGVVNPQIFAIGVIMVILTTLITPPVLSLIIRRKNRQLKTP
jgi:Kef-type K+ transport system membrane component KefB